MSIAIPSFFALPSVVGLTASKLVATDSQNRLASVALPQVSGSALISSDAGVLSWGKPWDGMGYLTGISVSSPLSGLGTAISPLAVDLSDKLGINAKAADSSLLDGHNAAYFAVAGSGMVYPGSGIAVSNGTGWGSSLTDNHSNWDAAYGWGNHANAGYVTGTPWTQLGYLASIVCDSPLSGAGTSASHLTVDLSGRQVAHANLTSLAGLTFASASFVKMTAAGTFGLDSTAYLTSLSGAAILTAANTFSGVVNPLTTPAESWIGPSATAGVYFKGGNVGIGTTVPLATLDIVAHSTGNEKILRFGTSGAGDSIRIINNYNSVSAFDPTIWGYTNRSAGTPLAFIGGILTAQDTGTAPVVTFQVRTQATETSATGAVVANRDLFDFANYGTSVMRIKAHGNVGISHTAPPTKLTVLDTLTTSPRGILSMQISSGTDGARVGFAKARGTLASPTTIVTGDILGRLMFRGYDGTNYLEMGSIECCSFGTIGTGRVPTYLQFSVATDAATSVLTDVMRVTPVGVSLGATSLFNSNFNNSLSVAVTSAAPMGGFYVGQDETHGFQFYWTYQATVANAVARLNTAGYSNRFELDGSTLVLQKNSAGYVGFGVVPTSPLHYVNADSSAMTDFLMNPTVKTSGNFMDWQIGGVSKAKVDFAGIGYFSGLSIVDYNIVLGTTTGTKIGTTTSQKLAFWNSVPVSQPPAVADPSGGANVDAECRAQLAALLGKMRTLGLIAT